MGAKPRKHKRRPIRREVSFLHIFELTSKQLFQRLFTAYSISTFRYLVKCLHCLDQLKDWDFLSGFQVTGYAVEIRCSLGFANMQLSSVADNSETSPS